MADTLKRKVVGGAFWTMAARLCTQSLDFVVGMVLARLLTPHDYGTVALMSIFFVVARVLVDGGFGMALVQKKDADDLDYNSVFYLSIGVACVMYAVMFFCAPFIAAFYKVPELVPMVRVSAITFFFNAINSVQFAEVEKKLLFDLDFRVSMVCGLTAAVSGIALACLGLGPWAIVWTGVIVGAVGVPTRWLIIAWRPKLMFSWQRLKPLFSYGWRMSASSLLDKFFAQLNGLMIGKFYSRADLAFVDKGQGLPSRIMSSVDSMVGGVSFPALVQMQDDRERLRDAMRRMIQFSSFVVFPFMTGIALCARPLIRVLFGDQWEEAVPYMRLACFSFALWPFHTINLRGILALGHSDVFLKLEIIKKTLKVVVILAAFRYGVFVFMAASAFALGPLSLIVNAWPNRKLMGYTVRMQLVDVIRIVAACAAMGIVVVIVGWGCAAGLGVFRLPVLVVHLTTLAVQMVFGAVTYLAAARILNVPSLVEFADVIVCWTKGRWPKIEAFVGNFCGVRHA